MNFKCIIARNIKKARVENKMTQLELSNLMFYSRTTITHIENGKISISSEKLIEFSKILNKPLMYFYSNND